MEELQAAIIDFKKRANDVGQTGKNLSTEQLHTIEETLGIKLPVWYIELMSKAFIVGIDFSIQEYENEDDLNPMGTSTFDGIMGEMVDAYPGFEVLKLGFINFADCDWGTGDPIFINLTKGENPPVYRIYHDAPFDEGIIEGENAHQIAMSISSFFKRAVFD